MSRFPTGYIPNSLEVKGRDAVLQAAALGSRTNARRAGNQPIELARTSYPLDQGRTGSCVGHSVALGVWAAARELSLAMFLPSPWSIYHHARRFHRLSEGKLDEVLTDSGARPSDAMRVLSKVGVRAMVELPSGEFTDCSEANINEETTLNEVESAMVNIVLGAHPVSAADTADALASRWPVTIAVPGGSDEFQGYTSGVLDEIPGEPELDHYVVLLGTRIGANGQREYEIRNSWGSWGMDGSCWVTEAFLRGNTGDRYAMQIKEMRS